MQCIFVNPVRGVGTTIITEVIFASSPNVVTFFPYPLLHKCTLPQATTAHSGCHYAPRDASDNGSNKGSRAYSLSQSWTEQLGVNGIMGTISEWYGIAFISFSFVVCSSEVIFKELIKTSLMAIQSPFFILALCP